MGSRAGRFAAHDLSTAEDVIHDVLALDSSWCNLSFAARDEGEADDSALFGFLAARGPSNPLATVMAATRGRRPKPIQVGIQHRAGTKAAAQLREAALQLPPGSRVAQDHPRRGLVVEWPENAEVATLIAWLFPAMRVLGRTSVTDDVDYIWSSDTFSGAD